MKISTPVRRFSSQIVGTSVELFDDNTKALLIIHSAPAYEGDRNIDLEVEGTPRELRAFARHILTGLKKQ